jgi:hypothetical protein
MSKPLYDTDFYRWTQAQAEALRTNNLTALDLEHLAEEIADLGKRDRRAVESFFELIALHLLKWAYQPVRRNPSWRTSVRNARNRLEKILRDSETLTHHAAGELDAIYRRARHGAADETGLPLATFPEACPWNLTQLQDPEYWP